MGLFEDIFTLLGYSVVFAFFIFILIILDTFLGAVTGYLISLTPLGNMVVIGMKTLFKIDASNRIVEIGATLGFLTGFFQSIVKIKTERLKR
jgi:hypothetical protein